MPTFVKVTRADDNACVLINLSLVTELRPIGGGHGTLILFSNGEHVTAKETPQAIATMKPVQG
jgi:hypothetical protein